jgi:uncharacterized protein YebE (UPF0316 family)
MEALMDHSLFQWVILPLLIFTARVLDVSLQTMRIVYVSRGQKKLAPIVGFFEVIIWLLAIKIIFDNVDNVVGYLAYGAGFALGNYVGIWLEQKMAVGRVGIRIITRMDAADLVAALRKNNFGVTNIPAEGSEGPVSVIYLTIRRCDYELVENLIKKYNPKAFFTLEDIRYVSEGIFPLGRIRANKFGFRRLPLFRKGK